MDVFPFITCEHAGNDVPEQYQQLFSAAKEVLSSHRGWDPGAEDVAHYLAEKLRAPLHTCRTTRLLVEPNRSLDQPDLFSDYSKDLSESVKKKLLATYYHSYRDGVVGEISSIQGATLHLSIHSFTPVWNGIVREVDIGLLFDPSREFEWRCVGKIKESLSNTLPEFQVKFNQPYRGIDDGFTTYLRTQFPDERYAGLEIEINQKFVGTVALSRISDALVISTLAACQAMGGASCFNS